MNGARIFSARWRRSFLIYTGTFEEPAFALLGNPAPLYSALLRNLKSFGAEVASLSIDVSTLERAHVACNLDDGYLVRIRLQGVEVNSPLRDDKTASVMTAAWTAVRESDASLAAARHELRLVSSLDLIDADFAAFIGQLATLPGRADLSSARLAWSIPEDSDGVGGSVSFEEATGGGVFLRYSALVSGQRDLSVLMPILSRYLGIVVDSVGLATEAIEP